MRKLITLLFALTIICSFSIAVSIGDEGHAWVSPAVREVEVGTPVSLTLGANPGQTNVYTVDVELTFDSNKLSITPNDIVIQRPEWSFPVKEVVGNTIKLQGYDFLHPFSGSKDIATLTFNTLSTGVAPLTLTKALLQSDPAVITILENGQVTVVAAQQQQPAACGNGIWEEYETCDDGNTVSGDGCSSACQTETGGMIDVVDLPVCGDGIVDETNEQCDDGNQVSGDGCSSACQNEQQQTICQAAVGIQNSNDINLLQGVINAIKNNPENKIDAVLDIFAALNAWFAAQ